MVTAIISDGHYYGLVKIPEILVLGLGTPPPHLVTVNYCVKRFTQEKIPEIFIMTVYTTA
jgi:hypothetical protein